MKITFYTDGASRGNPGRGGWGVYVQVIRKKSQDTRLKMQDAKNNTEDNKNIETFTTKLSGGEKDTTNNQMELRASIEALKYLKKNLIKILENQNVQIEIKTDSKYVKNGITEWIINWEKNGWKSANKKPVLNKELWQELLKLKNDINNKLEERNFSNIKFEYVEGHAGIKGNEIADELATNAADSL